MECIFEEILAAERIQQCSLELEAAPETLGPKNPWLSRAAWRLLHCPPENQCLHSFAPWRPKNDPWCW